MYTLFLYSRLTVGSAFFGNYTSVAREWQRSIRAVGGYWLGSFTLSQEDLTLVELRDFFDQRIGCRVEEQTAGMVSWEGLIYEMRLTEVATEYYRTLDPEWWHNKVKVVYSWPDTEDSQQANLTYNPAANSFQDDGQDFSAWQTVAGDAVYGIRVVNSDATQAWGFLGAAFTTTNPNDSVYVFTDIERTTAGWNGDVTGKTASTYVVTHNLLTGARQVVDWSENTNASDEYGEMQYIVTLGGTTPELATALRDRELKEFAWPRSRELGGSIPVAGETPGPAALEVSVVGYWTTLNWRYRETSRIATASGMVGFLVPLSEFVTVGRAETNAMRIMVDADSAPKRLGDGLEEVILAGDLDGHVWQGGVYAGRLFVYEEAPTTAEYYVQSDGALVDLGRVPVVPSLMKAGFLLRNEGTSGAVQPPGTSSVWDDPRVSYVDEVTFRAPDELEYHVLEMEESTTALRRRIERGGVLPGPHKPLPPAPI